MMFRTLRLLAALSIAACALPAQAGPINIRFGGEITTVDGLSQISQGDRWSLDLSYDWQPPGFFTTGATGYFFRSVTMRVADLSFDVGDGFFVSSITIANDLQNFFVPGLFTDSIGVSGNLGAGFGTALARMGLQMAAQCFTTPCSILDSLELPQTGEAFLSRVDAIAAHGLGNFGLMISVPRDSTPGAPVVASATGSLTSWRSIEEVSEPGALALFAMALAALGWLIRRRGVTEASRDPVA